MFGQRFATSEITSSAVTFQFAINTAATGASEKKAAFPLNLYGQDGASVIVNWGDGNTETLTSADYTATDSTASVHEYASAGVYTVTVTSGNWDSIYLLSCYVDGAITSTNNVNLPIYIWRRTLTAVESPLPPVKGVKKLAAIDATAMTASDNDLGYLFHRCEKMTSIPANTFVLCSHITVLTAIFYHCSIMTTIPAGLLDPLVNAVDLSQFFRYWIALTSVPEGLFDKCVNVVNMQETFRYCQTLETIPEGLFRYNTLVTNMLGMFRVCNMLKNFKLCIGSPSVNTVSDFIVNASNVTRIVCVPANSTTYTTFNSYKNSSNNIIVSTDLDDCIQVEYDGIWQFTVDTEATASGEKKAAIPLNLYGQNDVELTVDWGDNTTSTLTSSDYAVDDFTASVHEYASAGEYTITITSDDWENAYLMTADEIETVDDINAPVYYLRRTLTSLDSMLPPVKGTAFIYSSDNISTSNNAFSSLFYQYEKLESIPSNLFSGNAAIDNFSYCFCRCTSLASIPAGLFDNCTAVETFASCFENCTSLASIPAGLFDNNTAVTVFNSCFSDCTSLASIPSGLFDNNTEALWFGSCFGWCSSLTSIPSGLFDNNTAATNFSWCFIHCSSLASIPSGLFDNNTEATTFSSCFGGCTSLTSIPSGLFDNNTDATNFSGCFDGCTSLTSIPSGLFDNNTAVEYFDGCFQMCSSLASIPNGLFKNNTAATDFSYCFQSCTNLKNFHLRISSSSVEDFSDFVLDASNVDRILCVPANSTTYTNASSFANASNGIIVSTDIIDCAETWEFTIDTEATTAGEKKTGIPFNLYGQSGIELTVDWGDNTTSTLTSSNYTSSSSLSSIHEYTTAGEYAVTIQCNDWNNLIAMTFEYSNPNSNVLLPLSYFRKTLTSIDSRLPGLKGVCAITGNSSSYPGEVETDSTAVLFYYCRKLTSVPADMFAQCTAVTSFYKCFYNCTSLQSIPPGLFDSNTEATSFDTCFYNCTSLASIPSGLFDNNTAATNFSGSFQNCSSLQSIPSGLFDSNTAVTSFYSCFQNCSSLQSIPSGLFDNNTEATTFQYCFYGCSSLQSIPSGLFDNNTAVTDFRYCFYNCTSLQSIPSGLFDNNTAVTTFNGCFGNCTSLASIPSGLFNNNTAVTIISNCFSGCTLLADFTLNIGSSLVTSASSFVTLKSGTTRTINVPANSSTYTTFSNVASDLGLTIVGV